MKQLSTPIAFIGGGNMTHAIIGGLMRTGVQAQELLVVEPFAAARERLASAYGVVAQEQASAALANAALVVWAVKPQAFAQAAAQCKPFVGACAQLSVAAGIRSDSIAQWLGSEHVVRCMPNTPALIGKGMTALFARDQVHADERSLAEQVVATTGEYLWVAREEDLDAVTALSGSGPAYVFFFLEAMQDAGVEMGLSAEQAHQLAVATFVGASELARTSSEPPEVLRDRVTSKGGTTYAAITAMQQAGIKASFIAALHQARLRAKEMGDEFGKD